MLIEYPHSSLHENSPPRPHQLPDILASIWAPQPRVVDRDAEVFQPQEFKNPHQQRRPSDNLNNARPEDIGTIGDGRKKNGPDLDNSVGFKPIFQHVEQLLRTPPSSSTKRPSITLGLDTSPSSLDFSPAPATSLLTPTDLSPPWPFNVRRQGTYDLGQTAPCMPQNPLLLNQSPVNRVQDPSPLSAHTVPYRSHFSQSSACLPTSNSLQFFQPFSEPPTPPLVASQSTFNALPNSIAQLLYSLSPSRQVESRRPNLMDRRLASQLQQHQPLTQAQDWLISSDKATSEFNLRDFNHNDHFQLSLQPHQHSTAHNSSSHEPINFLSLLQPSSSPPYHVFVTRIIKLADQQASIFLQQKLKVADAEERCKIIDAICARGFRMMTHVFGSWAVQRCLEVTTTLEERRKFVSCMRGRVVDLATNCHGCHVLQKALDYEEDIRLLIVSELLLGDPAQTLVHKYASYVWSKIMELCWTPSAPPIFAYLNKSLKGKWASLACHETGSLVIQHAFENLETETKDEIVDEFLNQGPAFFSEVAKSQWGSYCIQQILQHGSEKHRKFTLDHLLDGLLELATNKQGSKSITKALKEGGKETLDRIIKRMCEPAKGSARRAMIVDLALSVTGGQLIASVLPA
ncbi:hypothetical protein APHAL10511_001465, partial [Amanita phalloides]